MCLVTLLCISFFIQTLFTLCAVNLVTLLRSGGADADAVAARTSFEQSLKVFCAICNSHGIHPGLSKPPFGKQWHTCLADNHTLKLSQSERISMYRHMFAEGF